MFTVNINSDSVIGVPDHLQANPLSLYVCDTPYRLNRLKLGGGAISNCQGRVKGLSFTLVFSAMVNAKNRNNRLYPLPLPDWIKCALWLL